MKGDYVPTAPGKSTRLPGVVLFMDVAPRVHKGSGPGETWRHTFRLVYCISVRLENGKAKSRTEHLCETQDSFWQLLERIQTDKRPVWVYAYQLSYHLDLLGLWKRLEDGEYSVTGDELNSQAAPMEGKRKWKGVIATQRGATFYVLRGRKGTARFVDVFNYCDKPIDDIANSVGVELTPRPENRMGVDDWCWYSESRARSIEESMMRVMHAWRSDGCGQWAATPSQLALGSYRASQATGLPVVDRRGLTKDLERDAFYGGRVYCGFVGHILSINDCIGQRGYELSKGNVAITHGPVIRCDSRSFYGSIMASTALPDRHKQRWTELHPMELRKRLDQFEGCAWVEIRSEHQTYPVRTLSGTLHATGHFWTALAGAELQRASAMGHVVRCGECAFYSVSPWLKDWAEHWWGVRIDAERAGDVVKARLAKMVLVSMFGKWAQMQPTWTPAPGEPCVDPWTSWPVLIDETGEFYECKSIGYSTFIRTGDRHKERSFPAVSAFIAAAGRERMRNIMLGFPPESVLYSHTDSFLLRPNAFYQLVDAGMVSDDEMGKFRFEGEWEEGQIFGPNHYRLGDQLTLSGVPDEPIWVGTDRFAYNHVQTAGELHRGRPDGSVRCVRVEAPIPTMPVLETVTATGWTRPPVVLMAADGPPPIAADGRRRVPLSLRQDGLPNL